MRTLKIISVLAFLIIGCWSATKSAAKLDLGGGATKSAAKNYAQNCARCHGADGRGDTELGRTYDVPNIADAKWQNRHSDKKIANAIAKGSGGMPAFGKKLTAEEITALVGYVRKLKN